MKVRILYTVNAQVTIEADGPEEALEMFWGAYNTDSLLEYDHEVYEPHHVEVR